MPAISEPVYFCAVLTIQALGIASVVIAQCCDRCWARALGQKAFFATLVAVGLATIFSLHVASPAWVSCATVLGVMSIGGSFDLGSRQAAESRG